MKWYWLYDKWSFDDPQASCLLKGNQVGAQYPQSNSRCVILTDAQLVSYLFLQYVLHNIPPLLKVAWQVPELEEPQVVSKTLTQ